MCQVVVVDDSPDFLGWLGELINTADGFHVVGVVESAKRALGSLRHHVRTC